MSEAALVSIRARDVAGRLIAGKGLSVPRVRRSLFKILKLSVLCSMATVTDDNRAHINTAYFCYSDDLELYFLSHPNSLHCRNLSSNSSMAMTIFSSSQKWGRPDQGLQLFGTCHQTRGSQVRKAEELYAKRFPLYTGWKARLEPGELAEDYRFYRFDVSKLKIFDEKGFGSGVFVYAEVRRSLR